MSLKSKIITIPTIVILLASLGLWYGHRDVARETSGNKDDHFLLSVKWKPEVLSIQSPVHITFTVDGVPFKRIRHVSPWGETMHAEPGVKVVLTARTAHPSTFFLDCIIMKNARSVPGTGYMKIETPGMVECVA